MKATAVAPTNIAFIKYWGKKDEIWRLPENGSISMNLSALLTTTSVEFSDAFAQDEVIYNGKREDTLCSRAIIHLDRIRKYIGSGLKAKVVTAQNFPPSTGLSSSASGFAALTVAGCQALGLALSEKELSILARQGSGSACRSIPDGFTEWLDGETSDASYAVSLFPPDHWQLVDLVVVVSREKKRVPTTEGMRNLKKSPFAEVRLQGMKNKLALCRQALHDRDLEKLGILAENEALEMHAVMITQQPPLLYWTPQTLELMKQVQDWRRSGLNCYFTINTGQNIHILCEEKDRVNVLEKLGATGLVKEIMTNYPAPGARIIE